MSCTKGAISGFVFYQQEAGRLQEPDLLLGLTQSQDNASFFLPGAPECHAGGGRQWGGVSSWSQVLSCHIFSQLRPAPVKFGGDLSYLQSWHVSNYESVM